MHITSQITQNGGNSSFKESSYIEWVGPIKCLFLCVVDYRTLYSVNLESVHVTNKEN